ncbi:MAG: hypothetical protein WA063_00485, partial [Minisyncoccia bacterium]
AQQGDAAISKLSRKSCRIKRNLHSIGIATALLSLALLDSNIFHFYVFDINYLTGRAMTPEIDTISAAPN